MAQVRLPVATVSSVAMHAGLLFLYLQTAPFNKKENLRVISDVDLLIQVRKPVNMPMPRPAAVAAPTTWNFLKMALPTIERAAPRNVEVKLPERRKTPLAEPERLVDKGKLKTEQRIAPLDLGHRRVEEAKVEAKADFARRVTALAEAPRLEEVGTRRVRDLPAAMALEERRREAVAIQKFDAIAPAALDRKTRAAILAAPVLREATPPERARLGDKMEAFLPPPEPARGGPMIAPEAGPDPQALRKKIEMGASSSGRRSQTAAIVEEKKKGVEIEGPLADRRVEYYETPQFPAWLREMGVGEAAVAIRFYVSPEGNVLSDMRVERTSGYGRLDRLTMDCLKKWKFAPVGSQERQWGVITFRFVME
ncbi:MAG: TonB family protein [Elusimicrobia bacterium]|nr:TonB family protein [Elusimicrobiota bacterium]